MVKFHIKGIKTFVSKGKRYYYDRKTNTRIYAPYGTPEFAIEVQDIRKAAGEKGPIIKKGTLGALLQEYQMSLEFGALAPRTQKDYRSYSKDLDKVKGLVLAELTAPHITAIRDHIAKKRTKDRANRVKTYLTTLFNWGIPHGHITDNPAIAVPKLKKSREEKKKKANRPWKAEEVQAFLDNTYPEMGTAIALAVGTSLREQDVIRLPWTAIEDERIVWTHTKTGVEIDIPLSESLKKVLETCRKSADTIVVGRRGKSYAGEDGFRANFTKERNRLAELKLIGKDCTFHGLRHTILTMIVEAGGTATDVMSVSGHQTESQVVRYTETANRSKGANNAVSLMNQHEKEQRKKAKNNERNKK
ncbi:putative Integrase [Candidatus Terasakiella magnetica]|uniref:Putative Integrase n=1 Tax=Candidatus Terasakiella magnetica TaxID=1867952 RepID=A0A1C3RHC3_9PROT|nr:tyrosine-type recombinase/integrase [Candidatus Terasakiella magnetica]SCA56669.1 putative Integrase [Candidatus Terasakiella magnetica]